MVWDKGITYFTTHMCAKASKPVDLIGITKIPPKTLIIKESPKKDYYNHKISQITEAY